MKNYLKNMIVPVIIVLIAASMRLMPHLPNFTPIAAMALFGGAYLNKRYSIIIPLLAMLISDIFLGFHSTMPYVYGSFVLVSVIGMWLKNNKNTKNIICSSLVASILFFIITNFGVWVNGWYPQTFNGLLESYIMGIPFFKYTLLGDMIYTGLFFGGYEFLLYLFFSQKIRKAH